MKLLFRTKTKLLELLRSDFLRKVGALSASRGIVAVMGFLVSVVLVRELGPAGSGLYFTAFSLAAIGVQLGNMGLQVPNTLLVARQKDVVAGLTANMLVAGALVGVLEAVLGAVLFTVFPTLSPVQGWLLALSLAWIPFGIVNFHFYNLLLAIQDVSGYVRIESISKILQFAAFALLAYFFNVPVEVFFAGFLLLLAAGCYWQFLELHKHFKDRLKPSFDIYKGKFTQGFRVYLISILSLLLLRIDILIVKYLLGAEQTGYYSVAAKFADVISMFPGMVAIILFPKISALTAPDKKWRLVIKSITGVTSCLLPCMILAYFLAEPAICLFYGARFLPAVRPFQLLIPGVFFLTIHMLMVQFLKTEGFPLLVVVNWLMVLALNIGLDLWLVPSHGIEAASAVSSICYFLIFALNFRIVFQLRPPSPRGK